MCHHECTEKLDNLISNINNESLKKICANIGDHVISIMDKKITDLHTSLEKSNECIHPTTNHYFMQKHFLLCSIEDVNKELLKNNAGFVFSVSDELYNHFRKKTFDHIAFVINTFNPEKVYKDMLYINSLIKKHTNDDKLLFRLKNQILICIFFI